MPTKPRHHETCIAADRVPLRPSQHLGPLAPDNTICKDHIGLTIQLIAHQTTSRSVFDEDLSRTRASAHGHRPPSTRRQSTNTSAQSACTTAALPPGWLLFPIVSTRKDSPMSDSLESDPILAVESLSVVRARFDMPDPTGTGAGDDGENADKLNHPAY